MFTSIEITTLEATVNKRLFTVIVNKSDRFAFGKNFKIRDDVKINRCNVSDYQHLMLNSPCRH